MSLTLPTSITAFHKLLVEQQTLIEAQAATIAKLTARLAKLEGKVNKNSQNSNKPPSSDGLKKKPAFPRKRGKRRGGQSGHKGET